MINKSLFTFVCCFLAGVFGLVETVAAIPDGPQRLRGLDGRQFLVNVEVVSDPFGIIGVGTTFANCYVFEAGGVWIDPQFPGEGAPPSPGLWEQESVGAKTGFNVSAEAFGGFFQLTQEGLITPAMGGGVLQITANTDFTVPDFGIEIKFLSVGFEVEQCYSPE